MCKVNSRSAVGRKRKTKRLHLNNPTNNHDLTDYFDTYRTDLADTPATLPKNYKHPTPRKNKILWLPAFGTLAFVRYTNTLFTKAKEPNFPLAPFQDNFG